MRKNSDLSTGQLDKEQRRELASDGAEMVACGVCFDWEFEFGVLATGKWLRIAWFPASVFPFSSIFPAASRKKNRATSPPESEPTRSIQDRMINLNLTISTRSS